MPDFKKDAKSTTVRGELYGQMIELGTWRQRLHDRYVHVACNELFNGHPLRQEILEIIQTVMEHLEIAIKVRRDKIEGIN